jgi:hypothetical protein
VRASPLARQLRVILARALNSAITTSFVKGGYLKLLKDLKWRRSKRHNGFGGEKKIVSIYLASSREWNGLSDKTAHGVRQQASCMSRTV